MTKTKSKSKVVSVKKSKPAHIDKNARCSKCGKRKGNGDGFCECGRPLFDGKDEQMVVAKLESAFSIGCTDEEACLQADISRTALFRYETKYPEFRNRKAILKEKLILVARANFNDAMGEKDANGKPTFRAVEMSKWYAERKRKSEFAPVQGLIQDDGRDGILTDERKAEIAQTMKNWSEPNDGDEKDEDYELDDNDTEKDG